jgi:hypothetical protein
MEDYPGLGYVTDRSSRFRAALASMQESLPVVRARIEPYGTDPAFASVGSAVSGGVGSTATGHNVEITAPYALPEIPNIASAE